MDIAVIDSAMADLAAAKERWANLTIADRRRYLEAVRAGTVAAARPWVEAAVEAKGLSMDDQLAGEEWTSGPYSVLSLIHDLDATLARLDDGTPIIDGYRTRTTVSGRTAVEVFPSTLHDRLLYSGVRAEVWMEEGVGVGDLEASVASHYREPNLDGDVCVVLAAGNIASIAPLDVIHEMFNEGKVVVLKMNPVNDYLGPFLEQAFGDLVTDGYLRFVYGGVDVGKYLTVHPLADSIHITGSEHTYEAIVYGSGMEGAANKADDRRINERPVEAELGGVGPVIVVPGPWTKRDLAYQAEQIVSAKMHNCGFNCIAAQVLVLPEEWELRGALLDEIRRVMEESRDRVPYYPGARERCEGVLDRPHPVETFGDVEPRYLIGGLDAEASDEELFTTEIFAPVLGVVSLPAPDVASYLRKAVRFVNERLHGTLGANLLIHPSTERRIGSALDQAIADLEYGTIAVNTWTGVAYFMPKLTWGAFPGHGPQDIQSGTGFVHNTLMFDRAEKSVVRGPFAPAERSWMKGEFHISPKPVYFVTNTQAHRIGERLIPYTDSRSAADLAKVASAAIRG